MRDYGCEEVRAAVRDLHSFATAPLPDGAALSILDTLCAKSPERQRGSTVEQLICNQWVAGSIPVAGSIEDKQVRVCMRSGLFLFADIARR